jgi:hypothetical protein
MKLKHGILYSSSSGNFSGGTVQSGVNGSTLYIRSRKKRVESSSHLFSKSIFFSLASYRSNFLKYSAKPWAVYASNFTLPNRFSARRPMTAWELFCYFNQLRLMSGQSIQHWFNVLRYNVSIGVYTFLCVNSPFSLIASYAPAISYGHRHLIFCSVSSKGYCKNYNKSFRFLTYLYDVRPSPFELTSFFLDVFGYPPAVNSYLSFFVIDSWENGLYPASQAYFFTRVI